MVARDHFPFCLPRHFLLGIRTGAIALLACAVLCLSLSGCAPFNSSDSGFDSLQGSVASEPEEKSKEQLASYQYRIALDEKRSPFFPHPNPSGSDQTSCSYALVNVLGFETPVLLLRAGGPDDASVAIDGVRVLAYAHDGIWPTEIGQSLTRGLGGFGEHKGLLRASVAGDGLLYTEEDLGTGEVRHYRMTFIRHASQRIVSVGMADEPFAGGELVEREAREIKWYSIDDLSLLDKLARGELGNDVEKIDRVAQAQDAGLTVLEGTLRVLEASELLEMQGMRDMAEWLDDGLTYVVLELDEETELTVTAGDNSGLVEGSASMIALKPVTSPGWTVNDWGDNGAHARVAINPRMTWWPSDVSLPINQPRSSDYLVLECFYGY